MGYECIRVPMLLPLCDPCCTSMTSCSGACTGSFRSTIWSINVNIAVFAPIPSANDRIATVANSGLRPRLRIARRTSDVEGFMEDLDGAETGAVYRARQKASSATAAATAPAALAAFGGTTTRRHDVNTRPRLNGRGHLLSAPWYE